MFKAVFILLFWLVSHSYGLASIGDVVEQKGNSKIERQAGDELIVEKGSDVESMDTVITANGRTGIQFVDDTKVEVTEHSRLLIDEFVYDPNTKTGALSLKTALGTVRYASGQIAKNSRQNISIRTPTAKIGVRGTDFSMTVDEFGATTVVLLPSCSLVGAKLACYVGEISVESDMGMVLLNQAFQATTISAVDSPPRRPLLLNPDETFISNLLIIRKPKYLDEEEEMTRAKKVADILDLDFLEIDILDTDLLALVEGELWYTILDYDPLAVEFLFDALDRSNEQLAKLLKSEFDDIFKETIYGYDPVLNIGIVDNEPYFTVIREDGTGQYIELNLDNQYGYNLNINQNDSVIENFELSLDSGGGYNNDINIVQNNF